MPRKGTGLQLSLGEDDKAELEKMAIQYGYVRGSKANITAMIEAIARKELPLFPSSPPWSTQRQDALVEAVLTLRQRGEIARTKELAALLLDLKELKPELRKLLDGSFGPLLSPWSEKIQELIDLKQPFQLSYQDAAGRLWKYSIAYAKFTFREKRFYLECWCDETQGNQDIPQLQHNWTLRLDRIVDAEIAPISREWRNCLDAVEVNFDLLGGLAHAYQQREEDIHIERLSVEPLIKRVCRRIFNTFWFVREVLPYGKDCIVIAPEKVRSLVIEQLHSSIQNYSPKT